MPIKTRNRKYYEDREKKKASRWFKSEEAVVRTKNKLYDKHASKINKIINKFYDDYGEYIETPIVQQVGTGVVAKETKKQLAVTMAEAQKKRGKITRLKWLELQLRDQVTSLYGEQKTMMVDYLSDVAKSNYYESIYEVQKGLSVGSSFNVLHDGAVSQLIRNPIRGANFSERYTLNRNKLAVNVNQIMKDGIVKGISNQTMTKELTNRMEIDKRSANRIIRTELTNTYNQSNLAAWKANGVVEEYEYIATLDNRTSAICQDLDGNTFPVDKAMTGLNYPPMHVLCRSVTAIVMSKEGLTRMARDEATGKTYTVPASMGYKEWEKKYRK